MRKPEGPLTENDVLRLKRALPPRPRVIFESMETGDAAPTKDQLDMLVEAIADVMMTVGLDHETGALNPFGEQLDRLLDAISWWNR